MSIAEAAASGDRRAALEAMRDKLARDMDDAPPAVVAQIAGRLAAILEDLDKLGSVTEVSAFDDLASRRESRLAASQGAGGARRGRQRRPRSS